MKKHFLSLIILCMFFSYAYAQNVGIGTNTPDASALLDIKSSNKGFLIPRMSTINILSLTNPAKGLLVLDTLTNQLMVNMGSAATPNWQTIVFKSGWNLKGNSSTDSATNFIGTTDSKPLLFRVNNLPAGQIHPTKKNTVYGLSAFINNTTGTENIAIGQQGLYSNTTGNYNLAIGNQALYSNISGAGNIAMGDGALYANTSGNSNVAYGYASLGTNSTGDGNAALGYQALLHNTTGNYNTASGTAALFFNTEGMSNTASGFYALQQNTVGNSNTTHGAYSLYLNTTGSLNTATGYEALYSNTTGGWNTVTGADALYSNTTGSYNTAYGYQSLFNSDAGYANTAIGTSSLFSNTTGTSNTATGLEALYYNTTGTSNTATGIEAMMGNQNGSSNTATGIGSLSLNVSGNNNVAVGAYSLSYLSSGSNNIAIGKDAGVCFDYTDLNNTTVIGVGTCAQNSNYTILSSPSTVWNGGRQLWSMYSDGRIKRDIKEDVAGLSFIMKLRPVTYYRNLADETKITGNDTKEFPGKYDVEKIRCTGFIAQEVEKAAQEINYDFNGVTKPKTSTDLYSLSYESFVMPLVKAVQELSKKTDLQQSIIEEQNKKIEMLVKEIQTIKEKIK